MDLGTPDVPPGACPHPLHFIKCDTVKPEKKFTLLCNPVALGVHNVRHNYGTGCAPNALVVVH